MTELLVEIRGRFVEALFVAGGLLFGTIITALLHHLIADVDLFSFSYELLVALLGLRSLVKSLIFDGENKAFSALMLCLCLVYALSIFCIKLVVINFFDRNILLLAVGTIYMFLALVWVGLT